MTLGTTKYLIEMVKDITVAQVSDSNAIPCKETGENVAAFMQEIYDKLASIMETAN